MAVIKNIHNNRVVFKDGELNTEGREGVNIVKVQLPLNNKLLWNNITKEQAKTIVQGILSGKRILVEGKIVTETDGEVLFYTSAVSILNEKKFGSWVIFIDSPAQPMVQLYNDLIE